jgi:SAM-dependent methyltransferase
VGTTTLVDDPLETYELRGQAARRQIRSMLPSPWSFEGKRVLDFGSGAGRTLRHFLAEAESAEFWACDTDEPSIAWLSEHLSPPVHPIHNDQLPPLPRPDGYFDLAYAVSVFTHLTKTWSSWLLELHRLLRDDGLLIATFAGEAFSERFANEPWDEDRIGMNVLRTWQSWDQGGPFVLHSNWWIRAHWGRAFEVLEIRSPSQVDDHLGPQSWVLMRKRPVRITIAELEAAEPGEEREVRALRHNVRQLHAEVEWHRGVLLPELESLRCHAGELERAVRGMRGSVSWRITRPLRALARRWRER